MTDKSTSEMDKRKQEEEQGLFFILNMLLASFQQRDFFTKEDDLGLIEQIYHVFDLWLELHLPSTKRSCGSQPNCYACCFNNPNGITTFDLWVLYLKEFKKLEDQAEVLKRQHSDYQDIYISDREAHQIRWIQTQTPCPFLDNGSCSIYQHRPLACRSHFSIRNPEQCHPKSPDFFKHPHKQRTLPMELYQKLFQTKEHPQDLLGACLWLLREHKTKP